MGRPDTKTCRACGKPKRLEEFHRSRRLPDGHHNECKDCVAAYNRSRRSTPEFRHKEARSARVRREQDRSAYNRYQRDYYWRKRAEEQPAGTLFRVRWKGRTLGKGHLTRQRSEWNKGAEALTLCGRVIPYSDKVEFANGRKFAVTCSKCRKACIQTQRSTLWTRA